MSAAIRSEWSARWQESWLWLCPGASRSTSRQGPSGRNLSPLTARSGAKGSNPWVQRSPCSIASASMSVRIPARSARTSAANRSCASVFAFGHHGRPSTWSQCAWVKNSVVSAGSASRTRPARSSISEGRIPGSTRIVCSAFASTTEFMAYALLWRTRMPSPRSVQASPPSMFMRGAASLLARRHDPAGDDLGLERVDGGAHRVGDLGFVPVVVDPRHALLGEPEHPDPARPLSFAQRLDGLENRHVDALDHRGEDVVGRLVVLVGVHADRELALLARRLEHAEPGRARGVIDDVGALVVLGQRQLLALGRVLECGAGGAGVLDDHLRPGPHRVHAGHVAGFELLDERDLHAAHEPELAGLVEQRCQRPDQV